MAITTPLDASATYFCDPSVDLWGCECPDNLDVGSCAIVPLSSATDFDNPATIDTSAWLDSTFEQETGVWMVRVDVASMPSHGLILAPTIEGQWDTESELAQYLSTLLQVPINPDTGWLEPMSFQQRGMATAYFRSNNQLLKSDNLMKLVLANTSGEVFVNNVLVKGYNPSGCSAPLNFFTEESMDLCVHDGQQQNCRDGITIMDSEGLGGTANISLQTWQKKDEPGQLFDPSDPRTPENLENSCVINVVKDLTQAGERVVEVPEELEEAQDTNPLVCDFGTSPPTCRFRAVPELIPPQGLAFPDPAYVEELDIRIMRVLADVHMVVDNYNLNGHRGTDEIEAVEIGSLALHKHGGPTPIDAACTANGLTTGEDELELRVKMFDERRFQTSPCSP